MNKLFLVVIAALGLSGCAGMDLTSVEVGVSSHTHYRPYRSHVYVYPHYYYTPRPVIIHRHYHTTPRVRHHVREHRRDQRRDHRRDHRRDRRHRH